MTPRTFWTIFLRIMGIWLIVDSMTFLPQLASTLILTCSQYYGMGVIMSIIAVILLTFIYFLILRYLVFRTDRLIEKLHLDQGFQEEQFAINIHRSTVLSISIIVIGGLVFIDALPQFCKQLYEYLLEQPGNMTRPTSGLIFYAVEIIIAILMMTCQRTIVNFIERNRKR